MGERKQQDTAKEKVVQKKQKVCIAIEFGNRVYPVNVNMQVREDLLQSLHPEYLSIPDSLEEGRVTVKQCFFSGERKVPNVYRFLAHVHDGQSEIRRFTDKSSGLSESRFNDRPLNADEHLKNIVLLLESPHEEEYNYAKGFQPIAPAQGSTGNFLNRDIGRVLNTILGETRLENGEYRVIIINPVPYQTSLHYLHGHAIKSFYKSLRNSVWKVLWDNESCFQAELGQLLGELQPALIINSCTAELKDDVTTFLQGHFPHLIIYTTNHPSAWWLGHNVKKAKE